MARWRRRKDFLSLTAFAILVAGCSRSKTEEVFTSRPDAMSAAKAALPPAASIPKPAGTGHAVLQANVPLPDGGTCSATIDRDCQECLLKQCDAKAAVEACESLRGSAAAGSAVGKPRSSLCHEALECIRRTKCHANSLIDCYCGSIDLGTCNVTTTEAKGVCKTQLDRALEIRPGSTGTEALNVITDPNVGGGVAGIVATCENTGCAHVCIPYQATSCR